MGNYSRDPKATLQASLTSGYCRVRFQQGKPVLDRELNLLGDLANPQRLAQNYLGNGTPSADKSFQITGLNLPAGDFTVTAGRCLVGGLEATLAANTTYRTQPHPEHVAAFPAGASNVYLRVFTNEITGAQDATLNNPGDVTFETAVRDRVEFEVLVSAAPINAPDHLLLAVIDTGANTVLDRRRVDLNLADIREEVTAARGSASHLLDRLDASLENDGTLKAGTAGLKQLKQGVKFSGQFTIAANTELPVVFLAGQKIANFLVGVTILSTVPPQGTATVSWIDFASQVFTIFPPPPTIRFTRGIRVKNESAITVTVQVNAIELV